MATSLAVGAAGNYVGVDTLVWTGSMKPDSISAGLSCSNWSVDTGLGLVALSATDSFWNAQVVNQCDATNRRLYCFQQ